MQYLLLIKKHNKTGLKYLCKHRGTKESATKYYGSGKYWKRHLKKHGKDLATTILLETTDKQELKQKGVYYSKLWDIVKNPQWANLIDEQGDGGLTTFHSLSQKQKWSKARRGKGNPMFGRAGFGGKWHTVKSNLKRSRALLGHKVLKKTRKKLSQTRIRLGLGRGSLNPNWKGGNSYHYRKTNNENTTRVMQRL